MMTPIMYCPADRERIGRNATFFERADLGKLILNIYEHRVKIQ